MAGNKYLTGKEIRKITKENAKEMRRLEKYKNRRAPESEFVTEMKNENNILEIDDLNTYFFTDQGVVKAVHGVSFDIPKNSTVGVVGESGCGKTTMGRTILKLHPSNGGQIIFDGVDIADMKVNINIVRQKIGMVFI